jgi:hypothetical protein
VQVVSLITMFDSAPGTRHQTPGTRHTCAMAIGFVLQDANIMRAWVRASGIMYMFRSDCGHVLMCDVLHNMIHWQTIVDLVLCRITVIDVIVSRLHAETSY